MASKPKRPRDANQLAKFVVDLSVGEADDSQEEDHHTKPKNQAAVELGRMGGLKGGKARANKLSPEKRSEIARKAVEARWSKIGKS